MGVGVDDRHGHTPGAFWVVDGDIGGEGAAGFGTPVALAAPILVSLGLPPVQVALTVVAGVDTLLGGDAPAELGGRVVPAEVARQLLAGGAGEFLPAPGTDPDGR